MINSVIINDKDNVIVAIEPIKKDEVVEYKDLDGEIKSLKALDDIKIYHKIPNIHSSNHVSRHNRLCNS